MDSFAMWMARGAVLCAVLLFLLVGLDQLRWRWQRKRELDAFIRSVERTRAGMEREEEREALRARYNFGEEL